MELQEYLKEHHVFFPLCSQAYEILSKAPERRESNDNICIHLHFSNNTNRRGYNLPTSNEVAIVILRNGTKAKRMRNIVVQ